MLTCLIDITINIIRLTWSYNERYLFVSVSINQFFWLALWYFLMEPVLRQDVMAIRIGKSEGGEIVLYDITAQLLKALDSISGLYIADI